MSHTRLAIVSGTTMLWLGCNPGPPPLQSFTVNSVGSAASLGNYAATCHELRIPAPRIRSVDDGTFTLTFPPSPSGTGTVRNLSVTGVFEADLEVGTSPTMILGPPACSVTPAVFVTAAKFVVDVRVTGSVDWKFGTQNVTANVLQKNVVITASTLQLPTFDVQ